MKLSSFFRKPRWLSRDERTRRLAIQHDREPELLAALPRLAREDPDAGVRLAALRRLADPALAQHMAHDDADPELRASARTLWLELITGTHPASPPLAERQRLLTAQDDPELHEYMARKAPEAALRRAALERVQRPVFLFERALEDPDAELRLSLVARIDDEAQLARLAERARKTDKALNRAARERIEALQVARGDAAAVAALARTLCEEMEALVREAGTPAAEAALVERWTRLAASAGPALGERFAAARSLLAASREPPRPAPAPDAVAEAAAEGTGSDDEPSASADAPGEAADEATVPAAGGAAEAAEAGAQEGAGASDPAALVAEQIAQARFSAALDEAQAARRQKEARERELLAELEAAIESAGKAVAEGASARAHADMARIGALRRELGELPARLRQPLARLEAVYAPMREWQHWADNQRRRELCEEIEALAGSGLHPDAVATRVREAQAEWKRLDELERRGSARPSGLGKRFFAACRAAMAPTEAYFDKRQELRTAHATALGELLQRAGALPGDADRKAATALRRELAEALRSLDRVDPRARKTLYARLKQALAAVDRRIDELDATVASARALLIREAEALTAEGGLQRGAVAAARELQQRWKEVEPGKRSRDQQQWEAFRAAIDKVFAALDSERSERAARESERRTTAEEACRRIEELAAAAAPERGALARLETEWKALAARDEDLLRRFEVARQKLDEHFRAAERARKHARFGAWRVRYQFCRDAERTPGEAQALQQGFAALAPSAIATAALAERFEAALSGTAAPTASDAGAHHAVLLELESLAGIEPAQADREERRQLQLARLAARMQGGQALAADEELAGLLERWSALGPSPDEGHDARLLAALDKVLAALD